MTVTVVNLNQVLGWMDGKMVQSAVVVVEGASDLADDVLSIAQDRVPVLSGNLRDSITREETAEGFRVYTDVVYAAEVEYGGSHNPIEPYMRPAADTVNVGVVTAAMKGAMERG